MHSDFNVNVLIENHVKYILYFLDILKIMLGLIDIMDSGQFLSMYNTQHLFLLQIITKPRKKFLKPFVHSF